jgi:hypothetical protein
MARAIMPVSHPILGCGRLMATGFVRVSSMRGGALPQAGRAHGWAEGECHECDDRQDSSHCR